MANVKITELVELSAADLAENDVLPIVDINTDTTKKVTIVSLRSYADANAYSTYTRLNSSINNTQSNVNSAEANIIAYATQANLKLDTKANVSATYFAALANDYSSYTVLVGSIANTNSYITTNYATLLLLDSVQDNVAALDSRVVQNTWYTYSGNTVTTSANIIPSSNNFQTLGSPSKMWGDVYVGPGTVYLGSVRLSDIGGALTITSSDNATTSIDTKTSNITAAINSVQSNVATLTTSTNSILANVNSVQSNVASLTTSTNTIAANVNSVQSNLASYVSIANLHTITSVSGITNNTIQVGSIIAGASEFTGSLTVTGNIYVTANSTFLVSANNLSLEDNMIYLNANNKVSNPDLGFAGNYNDGIYRHAGLFRDATDGNWKFFDSYLPEPDASPYIDIADASFRLANVSANTAILTRGIYIGGSYGSAGQVLLSDGTKSAWTTIGNAHVVQANVDTLTTSVNTIKANVDSVQSNVATAVTNINTVQSNVGTLTTSVNTIAANVNSVQSNVTNITNGTTAFTGVTTTFNKNVVISGNVTIGTNTSNTLIIVGSIDLGELG